MTSIVKILVVSQDNELLQCLKGALSGRGSPGAMRIRQDFVQRLRTARGVANASDESLAPRWAVSVCKTLDAASAVLETWAAGENEPFLVVLDADVDQQESLALFTLTVQAVSEHAHTLIIAAGSGAALRSAVDEMGDIGRCTLLRKPSTAEEIARSIMFVTWRSMMTSSLQAADQRGFSGVSAADLAGALLVENEAEQRRFAVQDALTKLGNRRLFDATLSDLCRLPSSQRPHALILIDLDRFKQVNDSLGHGVGDSLLQQVADRLREVIDLSDTAFRLGGDEFALIKGDATTAARVGQRIVDRLQKPFHIGQHSVSIGASIGWVALSGPNVRPEEVTSRADLALYSAKSNGRGCVVQFSPEQDRRRQTQEAFEQRVRVRMAQGAAPVVFTPIAETQAGMLVAAEVTIDTRVLGGTDMPAGPIEAHVSDPQLKLELGFWQVAAALEAAARFGRLEMAVNLTPALLASDFLADRLSLMTMRAGVTPQRLLLEAPSEAVFANFDRAATTLGALHKAGFSITLDHFGAGAFSIDGLIRLPIGSVKIDASMTRDVLNVARSAQLLMGLLAISAGAGLRITADGADSEAHWAQLIAVGCTRLQGTAVGVGMTLDALQLAVDPRSSAADNQSRLAR